MGNINISRREFLQGTAATCGAMLIGEVLPGMPSAAGAALVTVEASASEERAPKPTSLIN